MLYESDESHAVTTARIVDDPSWNRETAFNDLADPLIGLTLSGTYVVERLLGEGGMGRVYLANHTRITQKRVAIKVLHDMYSANAAVLARFQREAEAAACVSHPNVVSVMDVARTPDGQPYLVCEYLEGRDLGEHLKSVGRLKTPEALHIVRNICRGLQAAHKSGVIHRDLKPQNIFLVGDLSEGAAARPAVKILDFGLSRFLDAAPGDQLTQTGVIMGTPSFMAPEQARAKPVDHRADVYGVGAILYTVLTGRPPFAEDSPHATILAVLHAEPPAPRSLEPSIPAALEVVLARALARDPEARYPDAIALERALDQVEAGMRAAALPEPPPRVQPEPRPVQALPAPAPRDAEEPENPRLALFAYLVLGVVLLVAAAAASVPGLELAINHVFSRGELVLFLVAVAGSALTPLVFWFLGRRKSLLRKRHMVARLRDRARAALVTFGLTYGLARFGFELVDGSLARLFGPPFASLDASFAGWSLLLPLFALAAAFGRDWLLELQARVRPGWRRLLATWSAASLLVALLGSIWVFGLRWRDHALQKAPVESQAGALTLERSPNFSWIISIADTSEGNSSCATGAEHEQSWA